MDTGAHLCAQAGVACRWVSRRWGVPTVQQSPPGTNPRGKKHEPPGPGLSRFKFGSPLGYVVLLVLGFMLFRNVFQDAGVRHVTYSQFKDAIRAGQFTRVQLSADSVKGFLPE